MAQRTDDRRCTRLQAIPALSGRDTLPSVIKSPRRAARLPPFGRAARVGDFADTPPQVVLDPSRTR